MRIIYDALIKHKNTEERSRIFCDKVEFRANHLMLYLGKKLVFKVWLKKSRYSKYKSVKQACKDVGIDVKWTR